MLFGGLKALIKIFQSPGLHVRSMAKLAIGLYTPFKYKRIYMCSVKSS